MANDFTYHKVSEKEKQEILRKAKKLLDEFSKKLERIKTPEGHFSSSTELTGLRQEGEGWETDPEFRSIMFSNAPFVEDDSIIAEKGGWKE